MTGDKTREMRCLILSLILTALAVLVSHFYTCEIYRKRLNTPNPLTPPKITLIRPTGNKPARKLWVLILDGLRPDVATKLPHLQSLARRGVQGTLLAELPALTYPGLASMATGLPPLYSGVRINQPVPAELDHDSVSKAAKRAGYKVRYFDQSFEIFKTLLFLPKDAQELSLNDVLAERPAERELIWIYFSEIDDNGHQYGGRSVPYFEAAQRADALVARLVKKLDLTQDVLLIASEHGHLDAGGHGGSELKSRHGIIIAAGGPFKRGVQLGKLAMPRVATTLSLALDVDYPKSALGQPIVSAFGENQFDPMLNALPKDSERLAGFQAQAKTRLMVTSVFLCLIFGGLLIPKYRNKIGLKLRDSLPSVVYILTFFAIYFAAGYPLGWSMPRGGYSFVSEMGLFGFIAAAAACLSGQKTRQAQESLLAACFFLIPYTLLMSYIGFDLRWIEGTRLSFFPILLGCMGFTGCVTLGLRMLKPLFSRRKDAKI